MSWYNPFSWFDSKKKSPEEQSLTATLQRTKEYLEHAKQVQAERKEPPKPKPYSCKYRWRCKRYYESLNKYGWTRGRGDERGWCYTSEHNVTIVQGVIDFTECEYPGHRYTHEFCRVSYNPEGKPAIAKLFADPREAFKWAEQLITGIRSKG